MFRLDAVLYFGSIVCQVAAIVLALRLWRRASDRAPFVLLAAALSLMVLFRVVGFVTSGSWPTLVIPAPQFNLFSAAVSLAISVLLMLALHHLGRLSRREREAAAARRHTEQRLAAVVEHLPSPLFIKDPQGRYVLFNSTFLKYAGLSPEAVANHDDATLFPPAVAERFRAQDARVLATRQPSITEDAFEYEGKSFVFLVTKFPVYDADGQVVGVGGVATDVTDRKRAAESVLESERRLRMALDAAAMAIWEWDMATNRLLWSGHSEQIFGIAASAEWQDAKAYDALLHPDDRPGVWAAVERAIRDRTPYECAFRVVRGDGVVRWVDNRAQVFYDEAGAAVRMIGTARDVTAAHEAEAELRRSVDAERAARGEAEQVNRQKDEFLSTLSHELRTPLNAIVGWGQLLRLGALEPAEREEALAKIQENAEAQRQLVEDILDVSRIVHGKLRVEQRLIDLPSVVRAAIDATRPTAEVKRIRVTCVMNHRDDDEGGPLVMGDPQRLQQVCWNLLSNALKFTPEGGWVRVEIARDDGRARVAVSDNGKGIAAEFLPHVFERFRQADSSSTRQSTGLGLGLAIAKHVVELHGGELTAASDGAGRGATFTVTLPVPKPRAGEVFVPARLGGGPDTKAPAGLTRLDGVRVLVVDDNDSSRDVVARALRRCGAKVDAVASAAEAYEALVRGDAPDVLLSDIAMPDEDGLSLIRRVRQIAGPAHRTPAVAMTAYASEEDRRHAKASGFDVHVAKPVDPVELTRTIAKLARGRGAFASDGDGRAVGAGAG